MRLSCGRSGCKGALAAWDTIDDMKASEALTINSIDVDDDKELDALMAHVLAEGGKIYAAQRADSIRLGIIDEKGRLLKTELPEDMREDAGTDFGG